MADKTMSKEQLLGVIEELREGLRLDKVFSNYYNNLAKQAHETVNEAKKQLDNKQLDIVRLEYDLIQANRKVERWQELYHEMVEKKNRCQDKLEEHETMLKTHVTDEILESINHAQHDEIQKLKAAISRLNEQATEKDDEIHQLNQDILKLKDDLDEANSMTKDWHQSYLDQCKSEKAWRDNYIAASAERDDAITDRDRAKALAQTWLIKSLENALATERESRNYWEDQAKQCSRKLHNAARNVQILRKDVEQEQAKTAEALSKAAEFEALAKSNKDHWDAWFKMYEKESTIRFNYHHLLQAIKERFVTVKDDIGHDSQKLLALCEELRIEIGQIINS